MLKKTPIQLKSMLRLSILPFSAFEYYKAIAIIGNVTKFLIFYKVENALVTEAVVRRCSSKWILLKRDSNAGVFM